MILVLGGWRKRIHGYPLWTRLVLGALLMRLLGGPGQVWAQGAAPASEPQPGGWRIVELERAGAREAWLEDGANAYRLMREATADPWTRWGIDTVVDLDGDGRDEAVVFHFTGGAHCCSEYWIFSGGPAGIRLIDAFTLGNAGIGEIRDLDGDGIPELLAADDRLAYFGDLPYAASPFLPLVLCRTRSGAFAGLYVDCTPSFPDRLQEAAQEFEEALRMAMNEPSPDAGEPSGMETRRHWAALGMVAASRRAGDGVASRALVRTLCPDCDRWLLANGAELERQLARVQPEHLDPTPEMGGSR
jgi:hypothetical protein